ncbi:VanZ family protein [Acidobacteriota bacterium]
MPPILWMIFFFPVLNKFLGSPAIYRALFYVFKIFSPDVSAVSVEVPYIIIRKSFHFVEYAVLTFLMFRAFRGKNLWKWDIRWAVYSGVITVGYGLLDEFMQTFVSNRNGSIIDCVVNSIGVIFALYVLFLKTKKNELNEKNICLAQKG